MIIPFDWNLNGTKAVFYSQFEHINKALYCGNSWFMHDQFAMVCQHFQVNNVQSSERQLESSLRNLMNTL